MKKVLVGALSTAIVFSMCAAAAFAAGPGCGRYFADADGDGICDNYQSGQGRGCGYGRGGQGGWGNGFRGGRNR